MCVCNVGERRRQKNIYCMSDFAKWVWKNLKHRMGYGVNAAATMEQELAWINALRPAERIQKDGIKLMFCAYVYWIWRSRNAVIFQAKHTTHRQVINTIIEEVRLKMASVQYEMKMGSAREAMQERQGVIIRLAEAKKKLVKWRSR